MFDALAPSATSSGWIKCHFNVDEVANEFVKGSSTTGQCFGSMLTIPTSYSVEVSVFSSNLSSLQTCHSRNLIRPIHEAIIVAAPMLVYGPFELKSFYLIDCALISEPHAPVSDKCHGKTGVFQSCA